MAGSTQPHRAGRRIVVRSVLFVFAVLLLAVGWSVYREIERSTEQLLRRAAQVSSSAQGTLLVCGGGEIPDAVRKKFIELAGGKTAKVVLIPGLDDDESSLEYYREPWLQFEPESFVMLSASDRRRADDPDFVRCLDDATGVWFGGGQQNWIIQQYRGTLVEDKLHEVLKRHGVIGGTSAGAAVMSEVMVSGGYRHPRMGRGFGFIPSVVIDQHFLQRNRFSRLRKVLDQHRDLIGIGIDEEAAIVYSIANQHTEVIGRSYVVICVPQQNHLDVEFYHAGDAFNLADFADSKSLLGDAVEQVLFE